jgi:Ca-activated chloride channel homolog
MAQGRAIGLLVFLQLCTAGFGFQTSDRVRIVPRVQPQPETEGAAPQALLRVNASLVLIPAHVTTAAGASVTNLRMENFKLFEDGVQQTITHFAQNDAPVSVGLLLDCSGSMKNKMAKVSAAATEFFKSANPEDEFFLIEFNDHAKLKIPFTQNWPEISAEIARTKPFGFTALLDAVHMAATQMKRARNQRKAIVILSDGGDNFSRRSLRELKSALIESDVQVYALGIFDADYFRKHPLEERNGPRLLDEVAVDTGGQDFPVRSLDDLSGVGVQIARELRNQYVLGYSPANSTTDGKYHTVNVKVALPEGDADLHTYFRRGYYSPNQ